MTELAIATSEYDAAPMRVPRCSVFWAECCVSSSFCLEAVGSHIVNIVCVCFDVCVCVSAGEKKVLWGKILSLCQSFFFGKAMKDNANGSKGRISLLCYFHTIARFQRE